METQYISIEEAREIHLATIKNSGGGDCGELDIGKLESVLFHIQNDDYYPTFLDKLEHLFFCSCKFHCFTDGNISYHVAAGHIDEDLLRRILEAILNSTYDSDEELKLDLYSAISVEDSYY